LLYAAAGLPPATTGKPYTRKRKTNKNK